MADITNETGFTGLVEYMGQVKDDFLKEFHGKEAYKRFNEMRLNNASIGTGLLAIEYVIRGMSWTFSSEQENDPWLELVEEARGAMSQSWNDFISEVISFVWAGYSISEIIYQYDERRRILWRKFAPRGQDTVFQWLFDDTGGIAGFKQLAAPLYRSVDLPIEKLILFRTRSEKNNPEGRSLLRIAWTAYYYLKNLQQIEAIGFERDVAGMPKIHLPPGASVDENDTNSDASKAAKIVRNIRVDEQAGIIEPDGWEVSLMSGAGKSFADLANAIERYDKRVATAFFSQFLMLGQSGVGSLALSENSTDFFMTAINTIADIITDTFTKFGVYRLLKLNGATDEEAKRIKLEHTPANSVDISKISAALQQTKELLTWDAKDELWWRQIVGMPEKDVDELQDERNVITEQKAAAARAFAERISQGTNNQPNANQQGEPDANTDQNAQGQNNSVTIYAADPPDMDERMKFERQYKRLIQAFMDEQKKRIMKQAREMRKNGNAV